MIAVMQPQSMKRDESGEKTWSHEIWVMYKIVDGQKRGATDGGVADDVMVQFLQKIERERKQIRIISAWRYPGKTEPGECLPDEVLDEIAEVQ